MSIEKRHLAKTYITRSYPWGLNLRSGHRLLCADGVIRAAELAETADTWFSTPAKIRYKGKWISGYMSVEGWDGLESSDPKTHAWSFRPHTGQDAPYWPTYGDEETEQLKGPFKSQREKHNEILMRAGIQPPCRHCDGFHPVGCCAQDGHGG